MRLYRSLYLLPLVVLLLMTIPTGSPGGTTPKPLKGENRYLAMVEERIDRQWVALPLLANTPLVVLKFHISRSGKISRLRIAESSGNSHYDSLAQRAVQSVNPLPPFPPDISESFFDVQYRFIADPAPSGRAGIEAYKRSDYATALKVFRPLADQGIAEAQYHLGLMYKFGRGLPKDFGKAAHWTRLAAEQGHKKAQHSLGFMYEDGIGVPKDYDEAARWYRLACPGCDVPDPEMLKWINEGSTKSIEMDLDGDGQNEVVKEVWGPGVSSHSLTIEVYKGNTLIGSINPNKFGIQANYKIDDLDDDGKKEIITWSGLWDPRLPGEDGVTEETYEGHSAPHRYVFVTYKLIRGEYYPWNYYTTKKKYGPYPSWKGGGVS